MQYGRVFPESMRAEQQISPFCTPKRMNVEVPDAARNGGTVRGYQELLTVALAVNLCIAPL
jgi:hypothetical protein